MNSKDFILITEQAADPITRSGSGVGLRRTSSDIPTQRTSLPKPEFPTDASSTLNEDEEGVVYDTPTKTEEEKAAFLKLSEFKDSVGDSDNEAEDTNIATAATENTINDIGSEKKTAKPGKPVFSIKEFDDDFSFSSSNSNVNFHYFLQRNSTDTDSPTSSPTPQQNSTTTATSFKPSNTPLRTSATFPTKSTPSYTTPTSSTSKFGNITPTPTYTTVLDHTKENRSPNSDNLGDSTDSRFGSKRKYADLEY